MENRKGRECVDYDYFEGEADEEKGKYVYHYSYMYKLLVFFAATGFACYYGYSNNTKIISQDVYNVEYEVTDIHFRIPFLIGALGIPIIGYIGDKYG